MHPPYENLPSITKKQQEIVRLLYTYRFLNRIQIQTLLHHKSHKTISVWLKDLRAKEYVTWIYSTDFTDKSKPAIYHLGINGVRYLRSTNAYPTNEIRNRYYEHKRSSEFITRSMLLADIAIELAQKSDKIVQFTCQTSADLALPSSAFHFLSNDCPVHPDMCYVKQSGGTKRIYLLELLDESLPRYRVRRRLKDYVDYLDYDVDDWQRLSKETERPTVLFICPSVAALIYAKRRTSKLLDNVPDRDDIHIKFATLDDIRKTGFISKIWEEA